MFFGKNDSEQSSVLLLSFLKLFNNKHQREESYNNFLPLTVFEILKFAYSFR